MTRPGVRWRAVVCGVVIALGVTGCTTSSADDPSSSSSGTTPSPSVVDTSSATSGATVSSPPVSPTPSVIDVPTPSSTTPTPLDPEAQEIADRAAVEAAWANFWTVSDSLSKVPEADRQTVAAAISIDPTLTQILQQAQQFDAEGIEPYGTSVFHPHWEQSINGATTAVMQDCTDTSQAGTLYVSSGKKRTVGVPDNNTRATFTKGEDGVWRVREIFFLLDVPC